MFLYLPFLTVCSYVLIRVVEASATAKGQLRRSPLVEGKG